MGGYLTPHRQAHDKASETWDARLLVKPRKTISLERTKHEDRVRDQARRVAALLEVEVEG